MTESIQSTDVDNSDTAEALRLDDRIVVIGLSGGINSMAVLCWLKESGMIPRELHLYYAHFKEHSPDTFSFVKAGVRFAQKHFPYVRVRIARHSVISFFKESKMIPHPIQSPCSRELKIKPMNDYSASVGAEVDLVGYVKEELKRRTSRRREVRVDDNSEGRWGKPIEKAYPIGSFSDEWCFEIVDRNIGWHPAIYNILNEKGKRVFKHNNCLPCKNMNTSDMVEVRNHFPSYHADAMNLSNELRKYWGRDKDEFYMEFGRDLGQDSTCGACKW